MSLTRNSTANIVGALVPLGVSLITVPLYLDTIGTARYGVLALVWTLLAYFIFFDFGLGKSIGFRLSKRLSEDSAIRDQFGGAGASNGETIWTAIWLGSVFGSLGGLVLYFAGRYWLTNQVAAGEGLISETTQALLIVGYMLPVIVVGAVCGGAVTAKEKFIPLNVVRVAGSVMSQVVPLLLALGGRLEMSWLIGGAFVGNVFITSASLILCRRYFKLQFLPQFNNREVRPLLGYGSQVTLIAIVAPLLVSFDRLAISRVLNVAAVGIYSIPFMLVSKLLMLVEGASHTLFPRLASLGAGDAHRLVSQAIARLSALVTPIVILGIFWVTPFLKFWIGSEIADAARGLGEILLLGVWLNNLAKPPHVSLQASGRLRLLLVIYLLEIPIYWIVLIVLIDLHGLLGAAIAWTSRIAVDTLVMLAATGHIRSTITGQWYRATLVIAALVSAMATVPFGPMYWLALASLAFLSGIAGYAEMRATFLSLVAPNRRDADLIA